MTTNSPLATPNIGEFMMTINPYTEFAAAIACPNGATVTIGTYIETPGNTPAEFSETLGLQSPEAQVRLGVMSTVLRDDPDGWTLERTNANTFTVTSASGFTRFTYTFKGWETWTRMAEGDGS